MTSEEIKLRLINNDALFNNIFVIEQDFDIVPNTHPHYGASITYQDLTELRRDFLLQLVDTVIDWVYGSSKFAELQKLYVATVYKGNIIKNLIMDCQSYTKYRPNETTGGIFVSWRRKEELPTGA